MLTIKKNFVWILFLFAVILFAFKFFPREYLSKSNKSYFEIVQIDGGWGYNIYKNDSIYIHQMTVPAVEGNKRFKSESDAKKVASLVLEKSKKNQFPFITVEELNALEIK